MNSQWTRSFADFDLVVRAENQPRTVVRIGDIEIGGGDFVVMAGPCSVETEKLTLETAESVVKSGARILRGGAFKPRSSPYAFQGLGKEGLRILAKARELTGLAIVTEVMSECDVEMVAEYADILQIGTRNMENFSLLEAVAAAVVRSCSSAASLPPSKNCLRSAQLIVECGNPDVILCERGIRSFDTATRNVFDIAAVPVLNAVTHLPVIVDPSHAAGVREIVPLLARASAAIGADGMIVEVHPTPEHALSDGEQSLTLQGFDDMMRDLEPYLLLRRSLRDAALLAIDGGD